MTLEELLKEVEELDAKATKGPWEVEREYPEYLNDFNSISQNGGSSVIIVDNFYAECRLADQQFIVRARTLLPKLAKVCEVLYRNFTHNFREMDPIFFTSNLRGLDRKIESILSEEP